MVADELALSSDGVDDEAPNEKPDPLLPVAGADESAVAVPPNLKPPLPLDAEVEDASNLKPPVVAGAGAGVATNVKPPLEALESPALILAPNVNPEDAIAPPVLVVALSLFFSFSYPGRGVSQEGHTLYLSSFLVKQLSHFHLFFSELNTFPQPIGAFADLVFMQLEH